MKRYFLPLIGVAFLLVASMAQPAGAVVQFYNVYAKEYLDTHPDKEYAAAVKKAAVRCYICHQGKKRTNHNPFGDHLVEMLDRKKDLRDVKKISASIKKALEMHVDPKDEKSETYLDRVKASKWPGGELDELKKEPPEEQTAP
jgi:cytochrome c2